MLFKAGCETHADIRRIGYDGIARVPTVGAAILRQIGVLVGQEWPPPNPAETHWRDKQARLAWRERGATRARTVDVLLRNGCRTIEDIRRTPYSQFLSTPQAGYVTMKEIGALIGEDWPLKWWVTNRHDVSAKTEDLIAILEARGYKVIAPKEPTA